ncbi:hypothetical protein GCM10023146_15550 [Nocardioides caricicola]
MWIWAYHHPFENYHALFDFLSGIDATPVGTRSWLVDWDSPMDELRDALKRRTDYLDRIVVVELPPTDSRPSKRDDHGVGICFERCPSRTRSHSEPPSDMGG